MSNNEFSNISTLWKQAPQGTVVVPNISWRTKFDFTIARNWWRPSTTHRHFSKNDRKHGNLVVEPKHSLQGRRWRDKRCFPELCQSRPHLATQIMVRVVRLLCYLLLEQWCVTDGPTCSSNLIHSFPEGTAWKASQRKCVSAVRWTEEKFGSLCSHGLTELAEKVFKVL